MYSQHPPEGEEPPRCEEDDIEKTWDSFKSAWFCSICEDYW